MIHRGYSSSLSLGFLIANLWVAMPILRTKSGLCALMLVFGFVGQPSLANRCPFVLANNQLATHNDNYIEVLDGTREGLAEKRKQIRLLLAEALEPFILELVRQIQDHHKELDYDVDFDATSEEIEITESTWANRSHPHRVQIYWAQNGGDTEFGANEHNIQLMLQVARVLRSIQKDLDYELLGQAMANLEVINAHTFSRGDARIAFEELSNTILFATSFLTAHMNELELSGAEIIEATWLPQAGRATSLMDTLGICAPSGVFAQTLNYNYSSEQPLLATAGQLRFTPFVRAALRSEYEVWRTNRAQQDVSEVDESLLSEIGLTEEQAVIDDEFGRGCPLATCMSSTGETGITTLLREVHAQLLRFQMLN